MDNIKTVVICWRCGRVKSGKLTGCYEVSHGLCQECYDKLIDETVDKLNK
jgi:NMD protein affecting ribosome stability and mRNA decay